LPDVQVEAELYTDPISVNRIMDMIGTKGVNNSPDRLYIIRDHMLIAMKGEYIIQYFNKNISIMKEDMFNNLYKVVDNLGS
jgi:hypothetical protein